MASVLHLYLLFVYLLRQRAILNTLFLVFLLTVVTFMVTTTSVAVQAYVCGTEEDESDSPPPQKDTPLVVLSS